MFSLRPLLPVALPAMLVATSAFGTGCDQLLPLLPALAFCDAPAAPSDLAKLAEGPALFVDAVRALATEVGGQAKGIGDGINQGLKFDTKVLDVLGPYNYGGNGAYSRKAADDRSFRLRFFYGDGVAGKAPGTPLEADMSKLSSFFNASSFADLLNPTSTKGPLFPLIEAAGFTSGKLAFNDAALRLDAGTQLASAISGYDMKLNIATQRVSAGTILRQLGERKLGLSLEDTGMTRADMGFAITIKKFDMTVGLNGAAETGGNYLFGVTNGPLKYVGAVETLAGVPSLSLRCSDDPKTEFAVASFAGGKADVKFKSGNFPITLPGLAKLYDGIGK